MRLPTGYRDRVKVYRSGGPGYRDPVTGLWVKPDDLVLYHGPANVQAGGLIRANRRSTGTPFNEADGNFTVPRRALAKLLNFQPGDGVAVEYETVRDGNAAQEYGADAEITFVIPESRLSLLRYRD